MLFPLSPSSKILRISCQIFLLFKLRFRNQRLHKKVKNCHWKQKQLFWDELIFIAHAVHMSKTAMPVDSGGALPHIGKISLKFCRQLLSSAKNQRCAINWHRQEIFSVYGPWITFWRLKRLGYEIHEITFSNLQLLFLNQFGEK